MTLFCAVFARLLSGYYSVCLLSLLAVLARAPTTDLFEGGIKCGLGVKADVFADGDHRAIGVSQQQLLGMLDPKTIDIVEEITVVVLIEALRNIRTLFANMLRQQGQGQLSISKEFFLRHGMVEFGLYALQVSFG